MSRLIPPGLRLALALAGAMSSLCSATLVHAADRLPPETVAAIRESQARGLFEISGGLIDPTASRLYLWDGAERTRAVDARTGRVLWTAAEPARPILVAKAGLVAVSGNAIVLLDADAGRKLRVLATLALDPPLGQGPAQWVSTEIRAWELGGRVQVLWRRGVGGPNPAIGYEAGGLVDASLDGASGGAPGFREASVTAEQHALYRATFAAFIPRNCQTNADGGTVCVNRSPRADTIPACKAAWMVESATVAGREFLLCVNQQSKNLEGASAEFTNTFTLYGLDATTGRTLWERELGSRKERVDYVP